MAIDPATLKMAAKAAVSILTDEDARRKAVMVAIAPAVGILLLIVLFMQVITMPFQAIADFFTDSDVQRVEAMQEQYGYLQQVMVGGAEYAESEGKTYASVTLTETDNAPGVSGHTLETIYFNQLDARWKDKPYGTDKIGTHACGPTSMSIVISSLTGVVRDPAEMSNWAYKNGYHCAGNGSYHSLIPGAAKAFGLTCEGIEASETQKVRAALSSGKLVVAIMGKGHFTKTGHFIVLRGITDSGKILVADPASKSRSEQEWDLSLIANETNKNAGSGGPFWAIGNN